MEEDGKDFEVQQTDEQYNFEYDTVDYEELLISAVKARPPLYNWKLPLRDRSKSIKKVLWEEVSNEVHNIWSAKICETKFKSMRDRYRRERMDRQYQNINGPGNVKRKPWHHMRLLSFLDNAMKMKSGQTIPRALPGLDTSNTQDEPRESRVYILPSTPQSPSSSSSSGIRKRSLENPQDEFISASIRPDVVGHHVDDFCKVLASRMQQLSPEAQSRLQIKYLQLLHEEEFSK
ncbi:uncharacterized protein LOC107268490 isoform X2 [Cephus cinctus]|uniref:Uncharacterized protein LOC107268490 isoform X2 n=1 Tax=Cephus cinctus TaxID=211228 RepID=A0AAJ7FKU7_CEPCN|nr:uncharacterized protein LOC107268490 isoform X2 [Cephus cinctus]